VVQVKSDSSPVGDPVVQTLQGAITRFAANQALFLAWGGVGRQAEKFLETTKFTIRVWDASALMAAVFRTYPQLPEDIRADLPLKQVWIPVQSLDS
jgi:restriction system protein